MIPCKYCQAEFAEMADAVTHADAAHPGAKYATGGPVLGPRAVLVEPEAESTSARLARVERERDEALAARQRFANYWRICCDDRNRIQADLNGALAELAQVREHEAIRAQVIRERNADRRAVWQALGIDMLAPVPDAAETVRGLIAGLGQQRALLDQVIADRARLRAELASAARSGWIVARDGGRDCVRCDREIRRGEAYELLAGADPDALCHVHCPITEGAPT